MERSEPTDYLLTFFERRKTLREGLEFVLPL